MSLTKQTNRHKSEQADNNNETFKVAIIGGGIAGLSCASHLSAQSSIEPTVFDTGRLRPGGRCSSRIPGDKPLRKNENQNRILNQFIIDHAAQILTLNTSIDGADEGKNGEYQEFQMQVKEWVQNGILQEFPKNSVVEILNDHRNINTKSSEENNKDGDKNSNDITPPPKPYIRPITFKNPNTKMYYGSNGMGSIASAIAYSNNQSNKNHKPPFNIEQDVWISPSNGVKYMGGNGSSTSPKWKVQTNGKNYGTYDAIIIAHNGKCADRLMSKTPSKDLHSLLRVNFNPTVPQWGGKKMTLNSIYSYTIALKKNDCPISKVLEDGTYSAFIKNEPSLRFITCQSRKYHSKLRKDVEGIQVWTILSSAKFAKKYKGPQENLSLDTVDTVSYLMMEGLNRSLGLEAGTIHKGLVVDRRLQLWGAAVPLNIWSSHKNSDNDDNSNKEVNERPKEETGFLYDAEYNVGACGDWLLDPSIMGAWESGRRLSNWMMKEKEKKSIGLPADGGAFRVSKAASGSGIGNVR